jgi:hypothetical protein
MELSRVETDLLVALSATAGESLLSFQVRAIFISRQLISLAVFPAEHHSRLCPLNTPFVTHNIVACRYKAISVFSVIHHR